MLGVDIIDAHLERASDSAHLRHLDAAGERERVDRRVAVRDAPGLACAGGIHARHDLFGHQDHRAAAELASVDEMVHLVEGLLAHDDMRVEQACHPLHSRRRDHGADQQQRLVVTHGLSRRRHLGLRERHHGLTVGRLVARVREGVERHRLEVRRHLGVPLDIRGFFIEPTLVESGSVAWSFFRSTIERSATERAAARSSLFGRWAWAGAVIASAATLAIKMVLVIGQIPMISLSIHRDLGGSRLIAP